MSLSVIPLGPGMDSATRDNAINNNFRQLEAENRTKTIKNESGKETITIGKQPDGKYSFSFFDEDGDERIRIGTQPDGSVSMIVTKKGFDIHEAVT